MTRTAQVKAIQDCYSELQYLDLQDGFREVHRYLYDMNETAERQHRKGAPYGIKHGISVSVAAKLFVCEHLLDGWNAPDKWKVDDILSIRNEVLYAQAYAKRFHKELTEWANKWSPMFTRTKTDGKPPIDYAELMKTAA